MMGALADFVIQGVHCLARFPMMMNTLNVDVVAGVQSLFPPSLAV
jgi:hypothetical protein